MGDASYPPIEDCLVASDVSGRDGIGVEIYADGELVLEIFRDDTARTRTVSQFASLDFELLEQALAVFREKIPWDFE
ncbi:MAG: hypothetical protein VYE22_03735 [Myxococcota bacterium]|nr:hypothetical protein [Myxococcota bacterium]